MEKVAIYIRESNHTNAQEAAGRQEKKLADFCEAKGYSVCDSATVIGDRKTAFPVLMDLLNNAKDKGIGKIVMASTNRVAGTVDEIAPVNEAFASSEVVLETMDGSHDALRSPDFISRFLASATADEDDNNN